MIIINNLWASLRCNRMGDNSLALFGLLRTLGGLSQKAVVFIVISYIFRHFGHVLGSRISKSNFELKLCDFFTLVKLVKYSW